MRKVIEPQMQLGEEAIGAIRLDPKSRDDIPQLLRLGTGLDSKPYRFQSIIQTIGRAAALECRTL
jgi:hypothetical protein